MRRFFMTIGSLAICCCLPMAVWGQRRGFENPYGGHRDGRFDDRPWMQCVEPMRCELEDLEAALRVRRAPSSLIGLAHAMSVHADLFHRAARSGASVHVLRARLQPLLQLADVFDGRFRRDGGCQADRGLIQAWRNAKRSILRTQQALEFTRRDPRPRLPTTPSPYDPSFRRSQFGGVGLSRTVSPNSAPIGAYGNYGFPSNLNSQYGYPANQSRRSFGWSFRWGR